MTRRTLILSAIGSIALVADWSAGSEIPTENADTVAVLIDTGGDGFIVGVRTKIKCDMISVDVFYRLHPSGYPSLLLSKNSLAPCAGFNGYGGTHDAFKIPLQDLQFIRMTFLNKVNERETKRMGDR